MVLSTTIGEGGDSPMCDVRMLLQRRSSFLKYIVRYEENKAEGVSHRTPHGHGLDASGRIHWVHVWVVGSMYAMRLRAGLCFVLTTVLCAA